jgi:multicomponent Na+:H+ antiporter subunit G
MIDVWTGLLMLIGSGFCLVAAVGIVRLPDTLTRMHAATKAGTLGAGLLIGAEALFYSDLGISLRAITMVALLLLTAPVAAHLIGRASYRSGVTPSDRLWVDELKSDAENRSTSDQANPDPIQDRST